MTSFTTGIHEFDMPDDLEVNNEIEERINDTIREARVAEGLAATPEYATAGRRLVLSAAQPPGGRSLERRAAAIRDRSVSPSPALPWPRPGFRRWASILAASR